MTHRAAPPMPAGELHPDSPPGPLSAADWQLFLSALDHPPPLPKKMKDAIAKQRKAVESEEVAPQKRKRRA